MEKNYVIGALVVSIFVFGFTVAVINQNANGGAELDKMLNRDGLNYSMTEIEGMPCVVVKSATYTGYIVNSIDCDWRLYQGGK